MLTYPPVPYDLFVSVPISRPSRDLLRDCQIFANLRLAFVSSSSIDADLSLCPAHLVYGTVVAEVAAVLARPDRVLGPAAADLTEGAVGV